LLAQGVGFTNQTDIKMANGRGGARSGAGRPKGSSNRATQSAKAKLSDLAKGYAPEALEVLAKIMREGDSENARIAAANSIIDRGYGKPVQAVTGADDEEAPALKITIQRRAAKGAIRVTQPE